MTRPFRLKFANFKARPKIHGASSVHSRKFPVLLWRVSRGVKHNQVFQSIKVSHTSPTRRASTRACVRTPASRRVFPIILLISRQSFTHGCPRVDPGYGDSEPCLCARYAFHLTTTCTCLRLRSTDYSLLSYWWSRGLFWLFLSSTPACVSFRVSFTRVAVNFTLCAYCVCRTAQVNGGGSGGATTARHPLSSDFGGRVGDVHGKKKEPGILC